MSFFEYLSVLVSIIIGLGLSRLLLSTAHVLQAVLTHGRAVLQPYWVQMLWTLILFIAHIHFWWTFFEWRNQVEHIDFFSFLFLVIGAVILFVTSVLVLPHVDTNETLSLRDYYFRVAPWFFSVAALVPIWALVDGLVIRQGRFYAGNAGQVLFALAMISLVFIRRPGFHATMAVLVLIAFIGFIARFTLRIF